MKILRRISVTRLIGIICISASSILQLCNIIPVNAAAVGVYEVGSGVKAYSYSELLDCYVNNSVSYKRSEVSYGIEALSGDIAADDYNKLDSQYEDIYSKIAELSKTRSELAAYRDSLLQSTITADNTQTVADSALTAADNTHPTGNTQTAADNAQIAADNAQPATDNTQTAADNVQADIVNALTGNGTAAQPQTAADNSELIDEISRQITELDAELDQYYLNLGTVQTSMTDAKLQKDISGFYSINKDILKQEAEKKLKNDFLRECYSLIIYKEQLSCDQAYQDYLKLISQVEKIKFDIGLSDSLRLDGTYVDLSKNELKINKDQSSFDKAYNYIKTETKINEPLRIKLNLDLEKNYYDYNDTVNRFLSLSTGLMQLNSQIAGYQNYANSSAAAGNAVTEQANLKIEDFRLQYNQLEDNIKSFVKEAIISYDNAISSLKAAENDIYLKTRNLNAAETKLKYKKASKLDIYKAVYEKEAADAVYYQCCYEIIVWQSILDNGIYGATP